MLPGGLLVIVISLIVAVVITGVLSLPIVVTGVLMLFFVTAWCAIATNS